MNILNETGPYQPYRSILTVALGEVKLFPLFNIQVPKDEHSLSSAGL